MRPSPPTSAATETDFAAEKAKVAPRTVLELPVLGLAPEAGVGAVGLARNARRAERTSFSVRKLRSGYALAAFPDAGPAHLIQAPQYTRIAPRRWYDFPPPIGLLFLRR